MSALSIGSWVWGEQRHVCEVISIQRGKNGQVRLLVAHPTGQNATIPLERVRGFSDSPPVWSVPEVPTPLAPGQQVRLKSTAQAYTLIEIYDHFMGWADGKRTYETWARLLTDDGRPAHWKLNQLEVIEC